MSLFRFPSSFLPAPPFSRSGNFYFLPGFSWFFKSFIVTNFSSPNPPPCPPIHALQMALSLSTFFFFLCFPISLPPPQGSQNVCLAHFFCPGLAPFRGLRLPVADPIIELVFLFEPFFVCVFFPAVDLPRGLPPVPFLRWVFSPLYLLPPCSSLSPSLFRVYRFMRGFFFSRGKTKFLVAFFLPPVPPIFFYPPFLPDRRVFLGVPFERVSSLRSCALFVLDRFLLLPLQFSDPYAFRTHSFSSSFFFFLVSPCPFP